MLKQKCAEEAAQAQDFTCLGSLIPVFSAIFPTPLSFFSLSVFFLYLDPPFFLLLCLLIPLPAFSLSPTICFPPSVPCESRGVSWLWHREAPRMHRWCSGFPSLYFPENPLALSHSWEQMVFLQIPPVADSLAGTTTWPESSCPGIFKRV